MSWHGLTAGAAHEETERLRGHADHDEDQTQGDCGEQDEHQAQTDTKQAHGEHGAAATASGQQFRMPHQCMHKPHLNVGVVANNPVI